MPLIISDSGRFTRYKLYKEYGCLILSEELAVEHFPDEDSVLLRIKDDEFATLKYPKEYLDILAVRFADIDQPSVYDHMMDKDQAKAIVDFMEKYRDKKFVVHCQAGISRSSAAACAWSYMQGLPEFEEAIRSSPYFYPNAHVYRLLMNEIEAQERTG